MARKTCHISYCILLALAAIFLCFEKNTTMKSMTTCVCVCPSLEAEGANPGLKREETQAVAGPKTLYRSHQLTCFVGTQRMGRGGGGDTVGWRG